MKTMTVQDFVDTVSTRNENNGYTTFGVGFTKANGDYRKMSARRGVKVGVKNDAGTNGAWNRVNNDIQNNVLTVYDMNKVNENESNGDEPSKGAFRRISLDRLDYVKVKGVKYLYDEATGMLVQESE